MVMRRNALGRGLDALIPAAPKPARGTVRGTLTHPREGRIGAQASLWITLWTVCAKHRGSCAQSLWRTVEFV